MASRVGLTTSNLLAPTTAAWSLPFAAYYIFLQNRIVYHRLKNETYMGDTTNPANGTKDPLYVASRCQLNFSENVPLALLLALTAEINGVNRTYLSYALGALFALRVSHAEFGVMKEGSMGLGRILGYYGTQIVILGVAGATTWGVRGWLGF